MASIYGLDAFSPKEIAERVDNVGVTKARLPFHVMVALGILAGGFIGLGAMFSTLLTTDMTVSFGVTRLLGGVGFALGLFLVVVAGAELFTGNNLLVMAMMSGRVSTWEVLKNWIVVYAANFVGSLGLVLMVFLSNHAAYNDYKIGVNIVNIANAKASLPFVEALFKGILCNLLVCLAVWVAMAGRHVIDKAIAVVFPVTAFVAAGFEHSIANMYFIPLGIMAKSQVLAAGKMVPADAANLTIQGLISNLVPVTLGNIVGGAVLVAAVYYLIYIRDTRPQAKG